MMRGAESVSIVTMCSRAWLRSLGRMARMVPGLPWYSALLGQVGAAQAPGRGETLRPPLHRPIGGLVEIEHRPVVRPGQRTQPQIGVARGRMPDHSEHRVVAEAVAVRPRLGQIDPVLP